jgi:hypothetical protein
MGCGGTVILAKDCAFFETLAPTTSTGITAGLLKPEPIIGLATASGSTTTALILQSGSSAVDGETRYVGRKVTITAGTGAGESSTISAYTGSTRSAAVVFETDLDGTSKYRIDSNFDFMPAKEALLVVETNSIRYRCDGVAPAAGVGQILTAGQSILIQGIDNLRRFRCIDTASGASSVSVHVYF